MTTSTVENQLNRDLEIAFRHNPHLLKNNLHFNAKDGRVLLRGSVDTYFEKQMAQEALRNIDGISEIQNDLTVNWS